MKIFTYSLSQLPPLLPEIEAKVADLDTQIAALINENAGNYLALQLIERMLSDCTDTCDLNLNCIQIVADGEINEKQECSLKDLSFEQKRLVYSLSFTNSVLLNLLSDLTGQTVEALATKSELRLRFTQNHQQQEKWKISSTT